MSGGEAINARARRAGFEVDLRASSAEALSRLEGLARAGLGPVDGLSVTVTDIGRRPAGAIDPAHPLVVAAAGALQAAGITPTLIASSTDANAAHAVGLPAVALGVTRGRGEHTLAEWIEVAPVATGLQVLADTVAGYDKERNNG